MRAATGYVCWRSREDWEVHLELRRHPQPDVQQNRVVRSGAAGE
ncbi:hypothetical protein PCLA_04r0055 [Pseudomonas citronellolis]|nr:hypothetical protein PCLA_04r0055 [Pseudomonas citronellolis]